MIIKKVIKNFVAVLFLSLAFLFSMLLFNQNVANAQAIKTNDNTFNVSLYRYCNGTDHFHYRLPTGKSISIVTFSFNNALLLQSRTT